MKRELALKREVSGFALRTLPIIVSLVALAASGCVRHDAAVVNAAAATAPAMPQQDEPRPATNSAKPPLDRSGNQRIGVASFYAQRFAGRKMADGAKMDPQGVNAASRTLPLGTTAKVTNIKTGQSAVVVILDRGPYAKGRILDLSPATARKIGITHDMGIARVAVAPIAVPLPDGSLKDGVAARDF
ncbi:MAG TPA: septal ring lytic transglycosylase RlpA family protein [Steroidobacteraceae bacterium]